MHQMAGPEDLRKTAGGLARRLEAFGGSLEERDRQLLAQIMIGAMDPVERMAYVDRAAILSPKEEEFLLALRTQYKPE